jgi:hypothetical protein
MNKLYGKFFFTQNRLSFKNYDKKLVFLQRMGNFFLYRAQEKKKFTCAVNFCKTFCTCSLSSLGQDLTIKNVKK